MKRYSRKNKVPDKKIPFTIMDVDALGQGVSRDQGQVTFIAKTLPGETGMARLYDARKSVQFARLERLDSAADNRQSPECPHFSECPACDYLHTDYASELDYKRNALLRQLRQFDLGLDQIRLLGAKKRLGYRNRVQLHYRHKYLGVLDAVTDQVLEIPQCKIIREELRPRFDALYADRQWSADHPGRGHCELYLNDGAVSLTWNEPYAHGGFRQVNDEMNTSLRKAVSDCLQNDTAATLLDLFAGDGNLSDDLVAQHGLERLMIDSARFAGTDDALQLDLYAESALEQFRSCSENTRFDVLLLDPPRKGFANLQAWVKAVKPRQLIYVSCNSATMVRDLASLKGRFKLDQVSLVDLFPGTRHFETVVSISFK